MRGEYHWRKLQGVGTEGSPPLAWGIPGEVGSLLKSVGITPTCVGNTENQILAELEREDHPHLRGEYGGLLCWILFWKGSPPLAWGIRRDIDNCLCWLRITPTCVGNTVNVLFRHQLHGDHPHLRGEYGSKRPPGDQLQGSPPLAWGIL